MLIEIPISVFLVILATILLLVWVVGETTKHLQIKVDNTKGKATTIGSFTKA